MIVSIPMPGRKNAKGIDLSVSPAELNLEGVPGFEPLYVQLPVRSFAPALEMHKPSELYIYIVVQV